MELDHSIALTKTLLSVDEGQIFAVDVGGGHNEGCPSHVGDVTPEMK